MKTLLKDLIQADWGPAMRGIAWALGHAAMVPVAIVLVFAQWVVFTWRRPLVGALALVPVRRSMTYPELQEELLGCVAQSFGLTADESMGPIEVAASSPNLTISDLNKAGASIPETELGPMSRRMDFGMARPTLPAAPLPPVLAPAPRRQRRGSKRPQGPA
jgi:hypothetical protein